MTAVPSFRPLLDSPHRRLRSDSFAGAHRVIFRQEEVFAAPEGFVLPDLTGVADLVPGTPETARVHVVYHDSFAMTLTGHGITVRHHPDEHFWAVVSPTPAHEGEAIERELQCDETPDRVPAGVLALIGTHVAPAAVHPVAEAFIERVTVPLLTRGGLRLVDVRSDQVSVDRFDAVIRSYLEIVVQVRDLDGVGHALLRELAPALKRAGCVPVAALPELRRAFG